MADKRMVLLFVCFSVSYLFAVDGDIQKNAVIPEWGSLTLAYSNPSLDMAGTWHLSASFNADNSAAFFCDMGSWKSSSRMDIRYQITPGAVSVELVPLMPGTIELPKLRGFLTERDVKGELLRQQAWDWQPPVLEITSLFGEADPVSGEYVWGDQAPLNSDIFHLFYYLPLLYFLSLTICIAGYSHRGMNPYINWDYRIIMPLKNNTQAVYLYNNYRFFLPDPVKKELTRFCFKSENSGLPEGLYAEIRRNLAEKGVCP